ncbi:MAG: hypothetical protein HY901_27920 [Deltaproteobacteria bacterium]|nr:hypothetical protein [Deltaproteobacteria bacterium]
MAALLLVLSACQTPYVSHAETVRSLVRAERFGEAADQEASYQARYSEGERILALLNYGALLHDAGRFRESNACLLEVQDRLADFYRRSAGGEVARSAISGVAGDYLAEDFERILVHLYTIQNYLALGLRDDALVEVRRMTGRLGVLADVQGHGRRYRGDGFAQWIAGLLYEEDGGASDALISYRAALAAFAQGGPPSEEVRALLCADAARVAQRVGVSADVQGCAEADAARPEAGPLGRDGEVVLIHAAGQVAERTQRRTHCGFQADGLLWCRQEESQAAPSFKLVSIAVPELRPIAHQIRGAALRLGASAPLRAAVVEDVTDIAIKTLEDRGAEYRRQATTRALARVAASVATGAGAAQLDRRKGKGNVALGALVGTLTDAALSETEEADKRSWFTLPATFAIARTRVSAGPHRIQVDLLDESGQTVRTVDFGTVTIEAGRRTWLGIRAGR